jgi:hypothetical protein
MSAIDDFVVLKQTQPQASDCNILVDSGIGRLAQGGAIAVARVAVLKFHQPFSTTAHLQSNVQSSPQMPLAVHTIFDNLRKIDQLAPNSA